MQIQKIFFYCICITIVSLMRIGALSAEINNQSLALLVNKNDPESLEIAEYYKKSRLIPDKNIIYLSFNPNQNSLTVTEFKKIELQLNKKVSEDIQAYALAWRKPWRVDCMSITSAFTLGYSTDYCADGCKATKSVKYFNSPTHKPYTDFKIRPSMLLSSNSVEGVKKLIDRGVLADYSRPVGAAYLMSTSDKQRNVRAILFPQVKAAFRMLLNVNILHADAIRNMNDILFYFTGLKEVRWVKGNEYMPGAIADHLTSAGGDLFGGVQMSILSWIDAGVTGSYGAVVEPCNFLQKFPDPRIVIEKYLSNNSLIEAYWKSVKMPGQGLFVGEPLASPYKGCDLTMDRYGAFRYLGVFSNNFVEQKSRNCN